MKYIIKCIASKEIKVLTIEFPIMIPSQISGIPASFEKVYVYFYI